MAAEHQLAAVAEEPHPEEVGEEPSQAAVGEVVGFQHCRRSSGTVGQVLGADQPGQKGHHNRKSSCQEEQLREHRLDHIHIHSRRMRCRRTPMEQHLSRLHSLPRCKSRDQRRHH